MKQGWNTIKQAAARLGISQRAMYRISNETVRNRKSLKFEKVMGRRAVHDTKLARFCETWNLTLLPAAG